jgi:predicted nuclease of predicted toxin-antitoxin system
MSVPALILVDAHISPAVCAWIKVEFSVEARSFRAAGLRDETDEVVFQKARALNAVILTKDADFKRLLRAWGPPPSVIWVNCGNTSNARLRSALTAEFARALDMIRRGEALVEITDRRI